MSTDTNTDTTETETETETETTRTTALGHPVEHHIDGGEIGALTAEYAESYPEHYYVSRSVLQRYVLTLLLDNGPTTGGEINDMLPDEYDEASRTCASMIDHGIVERVGGDSNNGYTYDIREEIPPTVDLKSRGRGSGSLAVSVVPYGLYADIRESDNVLDVDLEPFLTDRQSAQLSDLDRQYVLAFLGLTTCTQTLLYVLRDLDVWSTASEIAEPTGHTKTAVVYNNTERVRSAGLIDVDEDVTPQRYRITRKGRRMLAVFEDVFGDTLDPFMYPTDNLREILESDPDADTNDRARNEYGCTLCSYSHPDLASVRGHITGTRDARHRGRSGHEPGIIDEPAEENVEEPERHDGEVRIEGTIDVSSSSDTDPDATETEDEIETEDDTEDGDEVYDISRGNSRYRGGALDATNGSSGFQTIMDRPILRQSTDADGLERRMSHSDDLVSEALRALVERIRTDDVDPEREQLRLRQIDTLLSSVERLYSLSPDPVRDDGGDSS